MSLSKSNDLSQKASFLSKKTIKYEIQFLELCMQLTFMKYENSQFITLSILLFKEAVIDGLDFLSGCLQLF